MARNCVAPINKLVLEGRYFHAQFSVVFMSLILHLDRGVAGALRETYNPKCHIHQGVH